MTGTISAKGVGVPFLVPPGESATWSITSTHEFIGTVMLCVSDNNSTWKPLETYTGTVGVPLTGTIGSGTVVNEGPSACWYAVVCSAYDAASDTVTWAIAAVVVDLVKQFLNGRGEVILELLENGIRFPRADLTNGIVSWRSVPVAPAPGVAINATAGNLNGEFHYQVIFVTALGRSGWGAISDLVSPANQQVNLTVPVSPDARVTSREVYRTKANVPGAYYRVATLANNTVTTLTDNHADAGADSNSHGYLNSVSTVGYLDIDGFPVFRTSGLSLSLGYKAGNPAVEGAYNNTYVGYEAGGNAHTTDAANTFVGMQAGASVEGVGNTAIGCKAGYANAGNYNVFVGDECGKNNAAGSGNVFIGDSAGYYETGSRKLFIDNTSRASEADARLKALIYGVFDAAVANQSVVINGKFACNAATPQPAAASGGTLAAYGAGANGFDSGANASALHAMVVAIRAALVANGIMS